jgi:hypothetical protein
VVPAPAGDAADAVIVADGTSLRLITVAHAGDSAAESKDEVAADVTAGDVTCLSRSEEFVLGADAKGVFAWRSGEVQRLVDATLLRAAVGSDADVAVVALVALPADALGVGASFGLVFLALLRGVSAVLVVGVPRRGRRMSVEGGKQSRRQSGGKGRHSTGGAADEQPVVVAVPVHGASLTSITAVMQHDHALVFGTDGVHHAVVALNIDAAAALTQRRGPVDGAVQARRVVGRGVADVEDGCGLVAMLHSPADIDLRCRPDGDACELYFAESGGHVVRCVTVPLRDAADVSTAAVVHGDAAGAGEATTRRAVAVAGSSDAEAQWHSSHDGHEEEDAMALLFAAACAREEVRYLKVSSVPHCAVLCCAVLCCAVLCCAVLCCAVLCCAVLCFDAWCMLRVQQSVLEAERSAKEVRCLSRTVLFYAV